MPDDLRIDAIAASEMEALLPLIAAYQRFYEVEDVEKERNRAFFSRFLAPSEDGMLLGAWRDGVYVAEAHRGGGIGRALIEASAEIARRRGAHQLQWVTAPDNETARRLYDTTGAESEPSIEYQLELDRPSS